MVNIATLKVGDKVHYIPFEGSNEYENGIVKEIPEWSKNSVRVVYHCNGDWNNYKNYTSQLTNIENLYSGWKH